MTEQEIVIAFAHISALPKTRREFLTASNATRYFVVMVKPYFMFTRTDEGLDIYGTLNFEDAQERCFYLQDKHPNCHYEVHWLEEAY